MAAIFWWVIFPYILLTIMIVGLLYRLAFRQLTWVAPSTEIFEKKWLRIGSLCFHWGIILAFIGHVMGILVPKSFYVALGIDDHTYHLFAIWGGGLVGVVVVIGILILLYRRMTMPKVKHQVKFADLLALVMLLIVVGTGTYMSLIYNTTVIAYEYRETIGPWFRSLFVFQPEYQLMVPVPPLFQFHVISAFVLFAAIPFTHLVHMFSFPLRYPTRPPQQYRSRSGYKR